MLFCLVTTPTLIIPPCCPPYAGWAGVIVNGCIRDAEALAGLDIGVKALASNPMKPGKGQPTGLRDVPVVVGGASIRPGDWVYSDDGEGGGVACFLLAPACLPAYCSSGTER